MSPLPACASQGRRLNGPEQEALGCPCWGVQAAQQESARLWGHPVPKLGCARPPPRVPGTAGPRWPQVVDVHSRHVPAIAPPRGQQGVGLGSALGPGAWGGGWRGECWGVGEVCPPSFCYGSRYLLAVTWAGGMICELKGAGTESIFHFHVSSCCWFENGLPLTTLLGDGSGGDGPRERPVVEAGAGALSTASESCSFLQVGTLAPTPPASLPGAHGRLPPALEPHAPPPWKLPTPGYGHLTRSPQQKGGGPDAGGALPLPRRARQGLPPRRRSAPASPALAAAQPVVVSVGAGTGRLGPHHPPLPPASGP